MKNFLLLALFIGFFSSNTWAQAPQAVCYQALAKDNQNNNIIESTIGIRATIVRGNANGISEWIETHSPQTDQFGLFTIEIGQGTPVPGSAQTAFENIKWGNGEYWLRIEFDPFNGGNYQLMGANKIISVPYALYAEGAGAAESAQMAETAETAAYADSSGVAMVALTALNDGDSDASNELQTLSFENGELAILDPAGNPIGSSVALTTASGGSLDDSVTNELQELTNQNGQLVLQNQDGTTSGNGVDFDESNMNELQTLSFENGELTILDPDGNPIGAPVSLTASAGGSLDDSVTNELQDLVSQNGQLVLQNQDGTINGNGVEFDESNTNELQNLISENGVLVMQNPDGTTIGDGVEFDSSNVNEIQSLVSQNGELVLQNADGTTSGSGVEFDSSNTNELQELSISGNTISISGGNTIELTTTELPFSAPGASYDLPQGIYGKHIVLGVGNYTVPQGKTFWVTAGGPYVKLKGLGVTPFALHPTTPNMPALPEGQVVQDCMCTGILIDNSMFIDPIVINLIEDGSFTVPEGKVLFVKSGLKNDEVAYLKVNNEPLEFLRSNFSRATRIIAFPAGTLVEPLTSQADETILTGFLIDEEL